MSAKPTIVVRSQMGATSIFLLMSIWLGPTSVHATDRLLIPQGGSPKLDGVAHEEEWSDAAGIKVPVDGRVTVYVRMKHDQENLYFAFSFKDNRARALVFPEILFDPQHDQSKKWAPDDWWFHVSGTDCEARGKFSDYSHCEADHQDWSGIPNYELSENPPSVEEIEIRIGLAKLGIEADRPFGISVTVEVVPDGRAIWPEKAALESPSTWATAMLGTE